MLANEPTTRQTSRPTENVRTVIVAFFVAIAAYAGVGAFAIVTFGDDLPTTATYMAQPADVAPEATIAP